MSLHVVGTCSLCGGQVTVPLVWHCILPPIPTCAQCGATAAQHGPVIPMNPPGQHPQPRFTTLPSTGDPPFPFDMTVTGVAQNRGRG